MERGQSKIIYVDIDGTICTLVKDYQDAKPIPEHIDKVNKLYDEGHTIVYYTARGQVTKRDWEKLTKKQLKDWGCKHHELKMNHKPHYDLLICDKSKRIEEI
jgi:histidinol phosphatase-like enzyme